MKGFRFYKAAAAALVIGSIVAACSAGGTGTSPSTTTPVSGLDAKPGRVAHSWNLGSTQATVTGSMIQPLSVSVTGSVATLSLYGTTQCAAKSSGNPCPNIAFTGTPPSWSSVNPVALTVAATTLPTACTVPAGAPSPAPGFVAACYIVAYEGGVGPYVISGPATTGNSSLVFAAVISALNFNGGNTPYNFFLAYVTGVSATPAPPTPSPVPTATYIPTATPVPTSSPIASPIPSACPTSGSWGDDLRSRKDGGWDGGDGGSSGCCSTSGSGESGGGDRHRHDGGDDGGSTGGCCSSSDEGDSRARNDHHHGGDSGTVSGCCSSGDDGDSAKGGVHIDAPATATPSPKPTVRRRQGRQRFQRAVIAATAATLSPTAAGRRPFHPGCLVRARRGNPRARICYLATRAPRDRAVPSRRRLTARR